MRTQALLVLFALPLTPGVCQRAGSWRLELRRELLGCYALYDSSGAPITSGYYHASPIVRLDSGIVRPGPHGLESAFRYAIRLDTARQPVTRGGAVRFWWADSLTDSIRISFSDHMSGAFVTLAAPTHSDTLRGWIENHWDVGPSATDHRSIRAVRVPCRAA